MIKRLKIRNHRNKYDNFKYNFYRKVQLGFLKLSKNKLNYLVLDSSKENIQDISKKIITSIQKII